MTKKTKTAVVVSVIAAVLVFYFGSLSGERYASRSLGGGHEQVQYDQRWFFLGMTISERKWSEPAEPPDPPATHAIIVRVERWRGLGLLWRSTEWLE